MSRQNKTASICLKENAITQLISCRRFCFLNFGTSLWFQVLHQHFYLIKERTSCLNMCTYIQCSHSRTCISINKPQIPTQILQMQVKIKTNILKIIYKYRNPADVMSMRTVKDKFTIECYIEGNVLKTYTKPAL